MIRLSKTGRGSIFDSFERPPKNDRPLQMPTNFIDEIDEPEVEAPAAIPMSCEPESQPILDQGSLMMDQWQD